jgi:hypothetical protein
MHFLFPSDPGNSDTPEDFFAEQASALADFGFTYSTFGSRALRTGSGLGGLPPGEQVVYRGWMLDAQEYRQLEVGIRAAGGSPLTTRDEYLAAHHLPNWYPYCRFR